jgi:sulfatase modifying factor 1
MRYATAIPLILLTCVAMTQAGVRADLSGDAVVDFQTTMDMPFITVGNPGNAGELSGYGAGGWGPDRICGAVDYEFRMGKFEVTAGQYTEFLNAVAATDTYGLYNIKMDIAVHSRGCNIQRSGSSGIYTYSVGAEWADRPVNFVGWGDATRFANWLNNGMPTGSQGDATTEDGAYCLNGTISSEGLIAIEREADARYVVPSEDEWYKAAFYDPALNSGLGGYYDFPMGSDTAPSNYLTDPDPGNNATFNDGDYTVGSPYWTTEVGEFENSNSPYGTFDQGGNVREWCDTLYGDGRELRGGSLYLSSGYMHAANREADHHYFHLTTYEDYFIGFRVAEVPEPATMSLLALGGIALLRRRRQR